MNNISQNHKSTFTKTKIAAGNNGFRIFISRVHNQTDNWILKTDRKFLCRFLELKQNFHVSFQSKAKIFINVSSRTNNYERGGNKNKTKRWPWVRRLRVARFYLFVFSSKRVIQSNFVKSPTCHGPQICHGLGRVWGNSCVDQVQIDRNQTHPLPNPLMHPSWTIKDLLKTYGRK